MNNIPLTAFKSKTLLQVSKLIEKRTATIRNQGFTTIETNEELSNLLDFQTQVEYARQLVSKEETVINN